MKAQINATGDMLTIMIPLDKKTVAAARPSGSGKSMLIASGTQKLPCDNVPGGIVTLSLNCYHRA